MTRHMNAASLLVLIATLSLFVFIESSDFPILFAGFMLIFFLTAVRVKIRTNAPAITVVPLLFEVVPIEPESLWHEVLKKIEKGSVLGSKTSTSEDGAPCLQLVYNDKVFATIASRQEKEIRAHLIAESIDSIHVAHIPDNQDSPSMTVVVSIRTE